MGEGLGEARPRVRPPSKWVELRAELQFKEEVGDAFSKPRPRHQWVTTVGMTEGKIWSVKLS